MECDTLNSINNDEWDSVLTHPFKILQDGRTPFHYACIRGAKQIIKSIQNLESTEIYKSDFDGNTGAHLLAINGWDQLLIELVETHQTFLKIKNNDDKFIANLVINRPITLVKIIKQSKESNLLNYLDYVRNNNMTFLLDLINIIARNDGNEYYYQVLKEMKNFNVPKNSPPLHYIIKKGYTDILQFVIENCNHADIDFNLKDSNQFTPLLIAFLYKRIECARLLLTMENKSIDVNYGAQENKYVPLKIMIKNELFELYEHLVKYENLNYNNSDNLLNTPAFYLIGKIKSNGYSNDPNNDSKINPIYKDILLKSDLNVKNFGGVSCNDLLALNVNKKKKHIKKNMVNLPPIVSHKSNNNDYGVFNPDSIHEIIYMLYILNKYDYCVIPMQFPNGEKQTWDSYVNNFVSIEQIEHCAMTSTLNFYTNSFFAFVPHIVCWRNKSINHVNSMIDFYLKRAIKSNHRFVILKLLLSPEPNFLHSNIVIYDKKLNRVIRFEPYGDWDLADSYHLDRMIQIIFEKSLDKSKRLSMRYIRPSEYLDKTKFQSSSQGDDINRKNLGDPDGYCLAWSFWFVELVMLNPDCDVSQLVTNAFDLILENAITFEPLLHHIRGYAKHLDQEKNKLLKSMGISEDLHYKLHMDTEQINLINDHINLYVKEELSK